MKKRRKFLKYSKNKRVKRETEEYYRDDNTRNFYQELKKQKEGNDQNSTFTRNKMVN